MKLVKTVIEIDVNRQGIGKVIMNGKDISNRVLEIAIGVRANDGISVDLMMLNPELLKGESRVIFKGTEFKGTIGTEGQKAKMLRHKGWCSGSSCYLGFVFDGSGKGCRNMGTGDKRAFVTGAGGFIGSHLVEALVDRGYRVACFVHYNSRNDWGNLHYLPESTLKEMKIVTGDIRDPFGTAKAMKGSSIVFHLASLIGIPYSYVSPQSYFETNIIGTVNVMEAALANQVEKVVHTSTSEVYGTGRYFPMDEKHPLHAQSPYSASKIGADMVAESYHRSFGLPVAIIRPFNTYGPRQSARAIIPTIITQVPRGGPVLLGNVHPTRDLNYVSDIVDAFVKVAESPKSVGEVINIGSETETSIKVLAHRIFSMMPYDGPIVSDLARIRPEQSEVERLVCDNRKACSLLGWESKVSLDEGLRKTIDWIKENLSQYKAGVYNV